MSWRSSVRAGRVPLRRQSRREGAPFATAVRPRASDAHSEATSASAGSRPSGRATATGPRSPWSPSNSAQRCAVPSRSTIRSAHTLTRRRPPPGEDECYGIGINIGGGGGSGGPGGAAPPPVANGGGSGTRKPAERILARVLLASAQAGRSPRWQAASSSVRVAGRGSCGGRRSGICAAAGGPATSDRAAAAARIGRLRRKASSSCCFRSCKSGDRQRSPPMRLIAAVPCGTKAANREQRRIAEPAA
jgi:hypothetical protein